jgi:formylglycine-generating enzyme required for sulfatase activity
MEFVRIRAGDFLMGAADGAPDQRPVHQVTISREFYLGKYEVTQAQWVAVMGSNPSVFKEDRKAGGGMEHVGKEIGGFFRRLGGKENAQEDAVPQTAASTPDRPVERVSWAQVQEFILRLNAREGHQKYRLPTEAEWEYAARAGTSGAYGTSKDEAELGQYAWYLPNAAKITHPVGQRRPNAWGLYDIQGNVWEWVQDWWAPTYAAGSSRDPNGPTTGTLRVLRGCSWLNSAPQCRLSERGKNAPTVPHVSYGFRLARDIP